jgi:AcrR family transcriptional regulator
MSDIAAALEMKRPTLYWYFNDLGEIFDAVVQDTDARLRAFVAGRLADVTHPIDYLDALMQASVDFYEGRRDHIIVLFQLWAVSASEDPERILRRGREFIEPVRQALVERVRQGIDDGLVAPCDADKVVDLVLSVVDGAQVQRVTRDAAMKPILDSFREYVLAPLRLQGPERDGAPTRRSRRRSK